jgi:hypothetical protein
MIWEIGVRGRKSPGLNGLGFPLCENRPPFEYCYVGGKFEAQKSCEIQTIHAIMQGI